MAMRYKRSIQQWKDSSGDDLEPSKGPQGGDVKLGMNVIVPLELEE